MENFALITLIEELKRVTPGMVVRRVVQHHARGFMLQTRATKVPALKLSLDAKNPAMYISGKRPPVETVATDFLMILRKHLAGAQLLEVEKPLSERIVELKFKTALPAKELATVVLVVELLPNAPNLFLLNQARRVLASFVAPNPRRGIDEYGEYRYPKVHKIDLAVTCSEDQDWFDRAEFENDGKNWLIQNVAGIGPLFAAEILKQHSPAQRELPDEIANLMDKLHKPSHTAWIYSEKPMAVILERNDLEALRKAILSPIELESLGGSHGTQTYPGILEAARTYYDELESRTLLEKAKSPHVKRVRDRKRRLKHQRQHLLDRLRRFEEAFKLQAGAQMLVASGADMDRHHESVQVTDYFGGEPQRRTIELDASKTLRENVARMFKQHQKAGRGMKIVAKQLSDLETLGQKLSTEESRLRSIGHWDAWMARGGVPREPPSGEKAKKWVSSSSARRRSIQIDGREVLVGRNGRENDELTFKVAAGDDFWLHVADYTGSHVIVRNPAKDAELKEHLLVRAAQLAAYYSQARNSTKVEVHYTRRKFVSKPRKAKPGLVRLREFKTIKVEPRNWTRAEVESGESTPDELDLLERADQK